MRLEALGFREVYDYAAGKVDWAAMALPVEGKAAERRRAGDVARKGVPTCRLDEAVGDVRSRVEAAGWNLCMVTDDSGVVLGRLRQRVLNGNPDDIVEQVMEEGPTTTRPSTELDYIIPRIQKRKVGTIVVTKLNGQLVGILYRSDGEREMADSGGNS